MAPVLSSIVLPLLLSGCDPKVQAYVEDGTLYKGDGEEERFDNALAGARSRTVSEDGRQILERSLGEELTGLFADAPGTVSGLGDKKASDLMADPALREALFGIDEDKAADLLQQKGVSIFVLHHDVAASLDWSSRLVDRLYHHDHLSRFRLLRVEDGLMFYAVAMAPQYSERVARASMAYLRSTLAGERAITVPNLPSPEPNGSWSLAASIRSGSGGHEQVVAFAQNRTLPGALNELAEELERVHRREVELLGFRPLREEIADLDLELHFIYERAYIGDRDEGTLDQLWEMGVDGAYINRTITESDGKKRMERGALPGAAAYGRAIRTADKFLRETAEMGYMSERRPWRAKEAWLELWRSVHYRMSADGELTSLYRGAPLIETEDVTVASVRDGIIAAGEWWYANLKPNGQVTYKMWPSENRYSNEYNFVRHTLATWNLIQAYDLDPRPEFERGARLALQFTDSHLKYEDVTEACKEVEWCDLDRLDVEGQMAYYSYNNNQKLGSVVVNMLGMIDLARITGSKEWDEQLLAMGRFVKFMQKADGRFQGYYVDPSHSYYTFENDIVPGEAALALGTLAEYTGDNSWVNGLPKYWEYYYPWFRDKAKLKDTAAPWPMHQYANQNRLDLVEFGPWSVMAANKYYTLTGDEDVAAFGLEIARWMIDSYQWTDERTPFPDYVGGYYKMSTELPAMQAFCYAEGTAAAYSLAQKYAPDEVPYFEEATRMSMRFALQMQYNNHNIYPFTRGDEVHGGIRYAMNETKVRIDYVYHAQSAMYQWYKAALDDERLPAEVKNGPPLPGQLSPFWDWPEEAAEAPAGEGMASSEGGQ